MWGCPWGKKGEKGRQRYPKIRQFGEGQAPAEIIQQNFKDRKNFSLFLNLAYTLHMVSSQLPSKAVSIIATLQVRSGAWK